MLQQLYSSCIAVPVGKPLLCPPFLASAGLVPAMLSFWICSFWVFLLFMLPSFRLGHVFPRVSLEPEVTVFGVQT